MVHQVHDLWDWLFNIHTSHLVLPRRGDVYRKEWNIILAMCGIIIDSSIYEIRRKL